ncbi:hypothetical protein [Pseudomonas sp. NA-150]|uniref:hypothetical protein n=1 Tax=Pseudomonas sp. NA-150 TaxID=3367525 RepID=UPI0037C949B2
MSNSRPALVAIALLSITACAMGQLQIQDGVGIGVWGYVAVALIATAYSCAKPNAWPGCLFELPRPSRISVTQRLLTQSAAVVCLLLAQCLSGTVAANLSVMGLLLFIHTLVLARLPLLSLCKGEK